MGSLIQNVFGRFKYLRSKKKPKAWKEIEYFDEGWKNRIESMYQYMPLGIKSIMDIGCGKMWLKDYLDSNILYFGIDYKHRGDDCYVCDLNKYEFPNFNTDIAFVSGCLEYIHDYNWLIKQISSHCKLCILSYCIFDYFDNLNERKQLGWVNNLSKIELINVFNSNGMRLEKYFTTQEGYFIFIFSHE